MEPHYGARTLQEAMMGQKQAGHRRAREVQRSAATHTLGMGIRERASGESRVLLLAADDAWGLRRQHVCLRNHTPQPHASTHRNPGIRNHSRGGVVVPEVLSSGSSRSVVAVSLIGVGMPTLSLSGRAAAGKLESFNMSEILRMTEPSAQLSHCPRGTSATACAPESGNATDTN